MLLPYRVFSIYRNQLCWIRTLILVMDAGHVIVDQMQRNVSKISLSLIIDRREINYKEIFDRYLEFDNGHVRVSKSNSLTQF